MVIHPLNGKKVRCSHAQSILAMNYLGLTGSLFVEVASKEFHGILRIPRTERLMESELFPLGPVALL